MCIAFMSWLLRQKERLLKIAYPLKYTEYVEEYSQEFGVDKYLIYAMIKTESSFDIFAEKPQKPAIA